MPETTPILLQIQQLAKHQNVPAIRTLLREVQADANVLDLLLRCLDVLASENARLQDAAFDQLKNQPIPPLILVTSDAEKDRIETLLKSNAKV